MIAVVHYNAGNIRSVLNALSRLECEATLTADPDELRAADKVIFPGVGEAGSTMRHLRANGLDSVLRSLQQPFLGICLGLQLMCAHTEEGNTDGLGIFDVPVRKFPAQDKVPHVGWNDFTQVSGPLFKGLPPTDDMYFVHSYFAELNPSQTVAVTEYITPFSAALHRDNFYATQFHPEKSADAGEQLLRNFLAL